MIRFLFLATFRFLSPALLRELFIELDRRSDDLVHHLRGQPRHRRPLRRGGADSLILIPAQADVSRHDGIHVGDRHITVDIHYPILAHVNASAVDVQTSVDGQPDDVLQIFLCDLCPPPVFPFYLILHDLNHLSPGLFWHWK